jgi:hypothetical protein
LDGAALETLGIRVGLGSEPVVTPLVLGLGLVPGASRGWESVLERVGGFLELTGAAREDDGSADV